MTLKPTWNTLTTLTRVVFEIHFITPTRNIKGSVYPRHRDGSKRGRSRVFRVAPAYALSGKREEDSQRLPPVRSSLS